MQCKHETFTGDSCLFSLEGIVRQRGYVLKKKYEQKNRGMDAVELQWGGDQGPVIYPPARLAL